MQDNIEYLRDKISEIDLKLVELLVSRFHYCSIIGMEKKKQNIPIVNVDAFKNAMSKYRNGLGNYGEEIYHLIHDISKKIQENETNDL
jgi:chorismate mutase